MNDDRLGIDELRQMRSAPSSQYSAGAWCKALNDALEHIDGLEYDRIEAREQVEDLRMKILKLATWYGHDEAAALGERWEVCEDCGEPCPPSSDSLCAKCYRTGDEMAEETHIPRGIGR